MSTNGAPTKEEEDPSSDGESRSLCHNCFERKPNVRACAQCKSAMYCSKTCQKEDWPLHKLKCLSLAAIHGSPMTRLMGRFQNHPYLTTFLSLALFHKFQALGRDLPSKTPLTAQIFFGVEPADIQEFGHLRTKKNFHRRTGDPVTGILQALSIVIPSQISPGAAKYMPNFQSMRAVLDEKGLSSAHLVIVEFFSCSARDSKAIFGGLTTTLALPSDPQRHKTLTIPQMSYDQDNIVKTTTWQTCLEFINMEIRVDVQNEYRLQKKMTRQDEEMIMWAMTGGNCTDEFGEEVLTAWRDKVSREDIYSMK